MKNVLSLITENVFHKRLFTLRKRFFVVFQKKINYEKHFPKILWKMISAVQEKTHPLRQMLL